MFEIGKIYWITIKSDLKEKVHLKGKVIEENQFMVKIERDNLSQEIIPFQRILNVNEARDDQSVKINEATETLNNSEKVIALKGNHEEYTESGQPTFSPCNLIEEAHRKRGSWQTYYQREYRPFLSRLYLAAILPGEILFVHGGVSNKINSVLDLRRPTKEVEKDLLWSDPFNGFGERQSRRGAGVEFGEDVTKKICSRVGVKKIIRSHEPRKAFEGPYYEHGGRVVTVSSTSVYGGTPFILDIDLKNFYSIESRRS